MGSGRSGGLGGVSYSSHLQNCFLVQRIVGNTQECLKRPETQVSQALCLLGGAIGKETVKMTSLKREMEQLLLST